MAYPEKYPVSTLSQRLARLRKSGMGPKTEKSEPEISLSQTAEPLISDGEGESSPEEMTPDISRSESSTRIEVLRRRSKGTKSGSNKSTPVSADAAPPGEGWVRRGDYFWERSMGFPPLLPESFTDPFVLPVESASGNLVFYDLETTGLSGGAGNTAFLIGLGFHENKNFTVKQLFLADYPGEEAMLRRYAELAGQDRLQVSYNGKSFDSQVLRTRFLLNRMVPRSLPQVDLLYPSRRLWKGRLESLSLRNIETDVLDFHRIDDLPGSEAPDAWFEWLDGRPERVEGVFQHNADDILSLAKLLHRLEAWGKTDPERICSPDQSDSIPKHNAAPSGAVPTAWGLARQWAQRCDDRELACLQAGWKAGERRCAFELAVRHRRAGRLNEAREVWNSLNTRGRDFRAAVELAKDWEHRRKDPEKALDILYRLEGMPLAETQRKAIDHRRMRLERKVASGKTAT